MTAPTISESLRVAAESMGLRPTSEQLQAAESWVATLKEQGVNSGTPAYEAELMAQGFMLGKWWAEQA